MENNHTPENGKNLYTSIQSAEDEGQALHELFTIEQIEHSISYKYVPIEQLLNNLNLK